MLTLFETFSEQGRLCAPDRPALPFDKLPWEPHPSFEGVELKHLVTGRETGGQFSYHLVRVAPGRVIGLHTHQTQLETHEVLAGGGACLCAGETLDYAPGVLAVLPKGVPHEVRAGAEGLCLFAKVLPALL